MQARRGAAQPGTGVDRGPRTRMSTRRRVDPSGRYASRPMASIHITDIEAAINWWRERSPSPDGLRACDEVLALAEVYALMVYYHEPDCDEAAHAARAAHAAWLAWYASTPDAPCIAICSTSQGDARVQGLRPQLRGGAALAGLQPGAKARGVAAHHARGHGLALQPLCRARAAGQRRRPPAARKLRAHAPARCRRERRRRHAPGRA